MWTTRRSCGGRPHRQRLDVAADLLFVPLAGDPPEEPDDEPDDDPEDDPAEVDEPEEEPADEELVDEPDEAAAAEDEPLLPPSDDLAATAGSFAALPESVDAASDFSPPEPLPAPARESVR